MAQVKVLVEGYYELEEGGVEQARATVSLVRERNLIMVVDPGFVKDRRLIIEALAKEGLSLEDVNIVCITHSHIDHYANIGMFPKAKILEYFGVWDQTGHVHEWQTRFTDDIQIIKTPGHDKTCITLFVKTDNGVVAICGDVFWKENYPEVDVYASNPKQLQESRQLVREMAHWIIPGHAKMHETRNGAKLQKVKSQKKIAVLPVKGKCKKCKRPFGMLADNCFCQEWLCYRCCECKINCNVCNCSVKARLDIKHIS